ncbi:MAG: hypothetical protein WBL80_04565, partial [Erysipelotrichaceae bacterium]
MNKLKSILTVQWTRMKNNKTIVANSFGAFFVKGGAMVISLLTMPAYMAFFQNSRVLGLWFTILAVLSWILTFDLGVGNGLRNLLVEPIVKDEAKEIKKFVSSAYISISMLMIAFAIAMSVASPLINWNKVFNIDISLVSDTTLRLSIMIIFIGILLQFLLKLIFSILHAMQKSALPNFLLLISNTLMLMFVLFFKNANIGNALITLSIVYVFSMNLPTVIATFIVFSTTLKESVPSFSHYSHDYAKKILILGGSFFWAQIMYLIITMTNEFLITWFANPSYVVDYQIYNKLFNLIGSLYILSLTPIWSAVTKAKAEGKYDWIEKLYHFLKKTALTAIVLEFLFIGLLQPALDLWLGKYSIKVNYSFALVFALSASLIIWNGVHQSLTNGFGLLKTQNLYFTLGAIINIPLAWLLVTILHSWIGVIVANIVSVSLYS